MTREIRGTAGRGLFYVVLGDKSRDGQEELEMMPPGGGGNGSKSITRGQISGEGRARDLGGFLVGKSFGN